MMQTNDMRGIPNSNRERPLVDRRYQLLRELGRGGTCVVHEAVHVITRRVVAVKQLMEGLRSDPIQRARVLREAEALAAVVHPNVVSVLDAGTDHEGAPFIALEFLEARTLEGLIASRGRLEVIDALKVMRQACEAVAAVHAAGLVHRDVKPGNMLLVAARGSFADLGASCLKLVDFGVAAAPWFEAKLTKPDGVVGTPEYLPVESISATGEGSTPAADVYGLGVTMFECLTGDVPFVGSPMQVMSKTLMSAAPPVKKVRPDVPDVVASIVDRAMSRDRTQRYANAHAMGEAVDAAIAELTRARPTRAADAGVSRRRAVRAPYITPVRVDFAGGSYDGRTEDLSEGGALVMLPEALPNGTQIQIRFALPMTGTLLKATAVVRWSKRRQVVAFAPCAIGVEFVDVDPEVREAIAQFVRIVGQDTERRG